MPTPSTARLYDFAVVSNNPIAKDIYRLVIQCPACAAAIQPGQFMNLAVPGAAVGALRVPLSFAGADEKAGTIELWYAVVGEGTHCISQMKAGEISTLVGPGGHGWTIPEGPDACSRALLVAGGIGVPPVLCLARALGARGISFDVCIGAASADKVVGKEEFSAAGAGEVIVCTDDGTLGICGFCTDPAAELLSRGGYAYTATCGPGVMMKKVAAAAAKADVYCEVSLERMMSCGFGACSTCNVETVDGMKGACMAGPVFGATKVVVF